MQTLILAYLAVRVSYLLTKFLLIYFFWQAMICNLNDVDFILNIDKICYSQFLSRIINLFPYQ